MEKTKRDTPDTTAYAQLAYCLPQQGEKEAPASNITVKDDPEELQVIRITKIVTPSKKKPTPAPRKTVGQKLEKKAENIYIPIPLRELKKRQLFTQIQCKRSQSKELRKLRWPWICKSRPLPRLYSN